MTGTQKNLCILSVVAYTFALSGMLIRKAKMMGRTCNARGITGKDLSWP